MQHKLRIYPLGLLLVALLPLAACNSGGSNTEQRQEEAKQQALEALRTSKQDLDAKRQELAQLKEGLAGGGEAAEGEEAPSPEQLKEQITALEEEINGMAEGFSSAMVDFINSDPPLQGEPLTETQTEVVRMKSQEDILVAREYIEMGGNYRRAIEIYNQALIIDPENPELKAALEEAEALRFMTEDRFSQVKKGMTPDEVAAVLGRPLFRNIREFDNGVIGWFYPTNEANNAAGIWFREGKNGELAVYKADFDALSSEDAG